MRTYLILGIIKAYIFFYCYNRQEIEKMSPMGKRDEGQKVMFDEPVKTMWEDLTSHELATYIEDKAELY